ncbi:hypothetical protein AAFP30_08200 [Gordonia sp. CPCC 205515]|uniref:hypothetical protein n=1 Tax=Gordonia sp. CPCC 205515 TaxID=3140791 RepID=UPI003AF3A9FD
MHDVTLTVADDHLGKITEVAAAARAAGMTVDQVLDQVGVICGTAPERCAPALQALDGVDAVELGQTFRVPPPDSPVQ